MAAESNADLMIVLGIIVLIVFIIAIIILIALWYAKKRREALEAISLEIGFSFEAKPKPHPHLKYPDFKLFNIGHSRKGINLMKGVHQGTQFVLFDYHYTIGHGKHSRRYTQTVAIAHMPDLDLPHFTLAPESFFSKVGKLFGKKDINFKTHKNFSDSYLLRGDHEIRIRQVFKTHLLNYFEGISNKINIEAAQDKIMVFKTGKTIKPEGFSDHLFEVTSTVKMISDAGS
jgi:hypothetical protein